MEATGRRRKPPLSGSLTKFILSIFYFQPSLYKFRHLFFKISQWQQKLGNIKHFNCKRKEETERVIQKQKQYGLRWDGEQSYTTRNSEIKGRVNKVENRGTSVRLTVVSVELNALKIC